jgi:hypothetical protein
MKLVIRRFDSRQGAKHAKFGGKRSKMYIIIPIFAALASLREIFRVSVLALPRQNALYGYTPDKLPTA